MLKLNSNGKAYAATTFAASMMHSMFMFYYVKIYINHFHVSNHWFQASQVVFLIWNAVNDPLFGYIQDNPPYAWLHSRRLCISYGAPVFAITFVLPWFPWGDYVNEPSWLAGVQLMICLCLYDAAYTFVLLAQCALFAELSSNHSDRVMLVRYSQVGSLLGSSSVLFSEYISANLENFGYFQIYAVVVAIVAWRAMVYCGNNLRSPRDNGYKPPEYSMQDNKSATTYRWWQLIFQIFRSPSFLSFVVMNFLQIYHMTYLSNFISIICDQLIPKHYISLATRSTIYGAIFIIPQLLVIVCTPMIERLGYYRVIRMSFVLRVLGSLFIFIAGPDPNRVIGFFLFDSALTNAVFSTFNLCLSDIIDEDIVKHRRRNPLSSLVFGSNALITKPAVSFSPLVTLSILESYGYKRLKDNAAPPSVDLVQLHMAMFRLLWATPLITATLQFIAWSFYKIRNTHKTVAMHIEN